MRFQFPSGRPHRVCAHNTGFLTRVCRTDRHLCGQTSIGTPAIFECRRPLSSSVEIDSQIPATWTGVLGKHFHRHKGLADPNAVAYTSSIRQTCGMTSELSEIRVASDDEIEEIVAIDDRASSGNQERISALSQGVQAGHLLVHESEDGIDGYVLVKPKHFFEHDFVDLLSVSDKHRRVGIGNSLLTAAFCLNGTPQLFTSTNQSNHPMRSLLGSAHWQLSGELSGLDPDDPELVFFKWRT